MTLLPALLLGSGCRTTRDAAAGMVLSAGIAAGGIALVTTQGEEDLGLLMIGGTVTTIGAALLFGSFVAYLAAARNPPSADTE